MADALETLLDEARALQRNDRFEAVVPGEDSGHLVEAAEQDSFAEAIFSLMTDRQVRPEHRARIYRDLVKKRDAILELRDPRLPDLIFWGEHVDSLYKAHTKGRLNAFHYARALEATCKRCKIDLLPLVGQMTQFGRAWAEGRYRELLDMADSPGGRPLDDAQDAPDAQPTS
ncbi:MAG: hypothetical protein V3T86_15265 [Planctomycetota bacterium]